jgi:predicted DNA-binding transcriptional regulator AlpA
MNLETLPPRIPVSVVCRLAGYSKSTLIKRIACGRMPAPIDRGKENLFLTTEVLEKLGIGGKSESVNPFEKALDDYQAA